MASTSITFRGELWAICGHRHACPVRQVKFPRSKKKRIRKKWCKRCENWAGIFDETAKIGEKEWARVLCEANKNGGCFIRLMPRSVPRGTSGEGNDRDACSYSAENDSA